MSDLSHIDLPTRPEDMVCFALYSASHAINRAYLPMLKELGLTYPQYIALTLLWERDTQTVGALSARMKLDTGTVTPLLKRLEAMGHVTRTKARDDGRQVIVALTEAGHDLRANAPDITRCVIGATGLELTELETLVTTATRLRDNMIAAGTSR